MSELEIFTEEHIFFDHTLTSKEECLKKFSEFAVSLSIGTDVEEVYAGFLKRESECTTGFGDGFAIPHTKCNAVKKPGVLFLKCDRGIEWQAIDDEPVFVAIALLVPEAQAGSLHMELLSALSRKLVNKEFKEKLLHAENKDMVYPLLMNAFQGK